jgi:predicted nucleotide-binding protein
MASRDESARAGRNDDEVKVLTTQISFLDEEIAVLRRRLADSPRLTRLLEERLREAETNLAAITGQNEQLASTLREARDYIVTLTEQVERQERELERSANSRAGTGTGIFVVHGHDEHFKLEVARLLENATEEEITILAEQPNRGKTIVEKLEQYSRVRFAVVLLTPDDRVMSSKSPEPQNRARQNVILELGLFLGLLGRTHVCVLYKTGVEIPSDYSGVLFIEADDRGAWKLPLLRELHAAEIPVSWERVR